MELRDHLPLDSIAFRSDFEYDPIDDEIDALLPAV